MVKRLLLLGLMVLAFCGASALISVAGGPAQAPAVCPPPPPGPPPLCGPAKTEYKVVRDQIAPIPSQLRRVRVVAPYLAGIAWPRTPLAFGGNPQTWAFPVAPGRYEWLVPVVEVKQEKYWTYLDWCCKEHKVPRCVYVKANYIRQSCAGPACGPVPVGAPPPMPARMGK